MSDQADISKVVSLHEGTINSCEAPGILLLSSSLDLISANTQAVKILQHLKIIDTAGGVSDSLPFTIRSLCQELLSSLPLESCSSDWHRLHLKHIIEDSRGALLFHGLGIPGVFERSQGHLLIVLVPLSIKDASTSHPSYGKVALTPREMHVAKHLVNGLTNKEIATQLGLSEHTVKDHVKRLMRKTHTTTRTGAVKQLLVLQNVNVKPGQRKMGLIGGEDLKNIA